MQHNVNFGHCTCGLCRKPPNPVKINHLVSHALPPHACMWQVGNKFMRLLLQIAEKEHSVSAEEGDEGSSYGSGHSSEGLMEPPELAAEAGEEEDMPTLIAAIAALSRGQAIVVEKLTLLEKVVGTLQLEMNSVRDDMKVVHQVMGRVADHVCDIRDVTADVERLKEQVSMDAIPPQHWKEMPHGMEITRAPHASTSRAKPTRGENDDPHSNAGFDEGGYHFDETQTYQHNPDTPMNMTDSPEPDRYEWGYHREISPAERSPPCTQQVVSIDKEPLEEESQQLEMSCQTTQMPTMVGPSMWADFTRAVRDWPPPSVAGTARDDGWVSTKKGRWDVTINGKDLPETGGDQRRKTMATLT